ncbi:deleted in malignant brain tumors 1 protein-like [Lytechinus variegatus]|uniref:deleted in malignant brain tumors 1 protein-like n=1 Tax=Lytechinus variegatus TaxID=7654 RepID=UPI001BB1FF06|nr:deleted in malignant brain tumors 1 protein-like [Lytechinus variegatus]
MLATRASLWGSLLLIIGATILQISDAQNENVRLVGGENAYEGRIEVLHDGAWGTVCDDSFTDVDAQVACRSLGLTGGVAHSQAHFGQGSGQILMDNLACDGTENALDECGHNGWGSHNCGHHEDAGVACEAPAEPEPDIRLVGGANAFEGRVEIKHNGVWGTVCDDSFYDSDAEVVCRSLGLSGGSVRCCATFGQGTGPILLDDVTCSGYSEDSLGDCDHRGWGSHNCGHSEDVGVVCEPANDYSSYDYSSDYSSYDYSSYDYSSYDYSSDYSSYDYSSYDYSSDYPSYDYSSYDYSSYDYSSYDYSSDYSSYDYSSYDYSSDYSSYDYSSYDYSSYDYSSYDYSSYDYSSYDYSSYDYSSYDYSSYDYSSYDYSSYDYSSYDYSSYDYSSYDYSSYDYSSYDYSSYDYSSYAEPEPDIRLVGGANAFEGRVEIKHNGVWGTVCDDSFYNSDAEVVCRSLGLSGGTARCCAAFGQGTGPIWLDDVTCSGYSEDSLGDCYHRGWGSHNCGHSEDVGVVCEPAYDYSSYDYSSYDYSSYDYSSDYPSYVYPSYDYSSYDYSSYDYSSYDYSSYDYSSYDYSSYDYSSYDYSSDYPSYDYSSYDYSSYDYSSYDYSSYDYSSYDYSSYDYSSYAEPEPDIRLVGGANAFEGRVEIKHNGVWGTVCDDSFYNSDAEVVCRSLGLSGGTARCCAAFGQGTGPIWLDDVTCSGYSEDSLGDCYHRGWGSHNCAHSEDVGVVCEPAYDYSSYDYSSYDYSSYDYSSDYSSYDYSSYDYSSYDYSSDYSSYDYSSSDYSSYDYSSYDYVLHSSCRSDQFECYNGECIPGAWICDHDNDCSYGEDEYNCDYPPTSWPTWEPETTESNNLPPWTTETYGCGPDQFQCYNGNCIPDYWQCDYINDCSYNEDEQNCGEYTTYSWEPETTESYGCMPDEFSCSNGYCIPHYWVCDHYSDCLNNEDEEYCDYPTPNPAGHFVCSDGAVIPSSEQCNGYVDCSDHSDEAFCGPTCQWYEEFECADGMCISSDQFCNGVVDCPLYGEDEWYCDYDYSSWSYYDSYSDYWPSYSYWPSEPESGTCVNMCSCGETGDGGIDQCRSGDCYCDDICKRFGDCCSDKDYFCPVEGLDGGLYYIEKVQDLPVHVRRRRAAEGQKRRARRSVPKEVDQERARRLEDQAKRLEGRRARAAEKARQVRQAEA